MLNVNLVGRLWAHKLTLNIQHLTLRTAHNIQNSKLKIAHRATIQNSKFKTHNS